MGAPKVTEAAIARAIQGAARGARSLGREPGAVEVRPDGSVFIVLVPKGETVMQLSGTKALEDEDSNGW